MARGMLEVELVGAEDDAPATVAPRRLPRRWLVGGAVLAAAALGLTQWIGLTRERAELARLAAVPGVLALVDPTLVVARRVPPRDLGELYGSGAWSLVVGGDGAQTLTWDGWTTELAGPDKALADSDGQVMGGSTCRPDVAPDADPSTASRVVCLVTDGGMIFDGAGGVATVPATTRRVVVLSAADGSRIAQWPVDRGATLELFAGAVVLGSATAQDITVAAYGLLTGEQRWTHVDPWPDDLDHSAQDQTAVSVFRAGDLLAYSPPGRSLVLLSADGTVVRHLDEVGTGGWGWNNDPSSGRLVMQTQDATGSSLTRFVAADGDPGSDVTVDGWPLEMSVDDGSVPGLLLTSDGTVRAWDAGTGAARWSHDVTIVSSVVVLRGRVYLATSRDVLALDGRTGRLLWTTARQTGLLPRSLLTDGRHILVGFDAASSAGPPPLVAYDPATGHEDFRASYPDGVTDITSIRGRLVGHDAATDEYLVLE